MNLKKKMVKIPIPLSVEEDISEEEFVGVMKKLCERVARLEMNEMKNYNRINEFRQFVNKLPGASPAMKDAHNFDKLVDAQEKCPNKNFVSGPEEYVKLTRHVSFEEVATKEQVEERDRREEERSKELVEGLRNPELEEMRAKGKAAEERLLKSVEDSLKECEIYKPTVEDVRTSIVTRWVGPNMAVRQSIDPVKPFVNTEGIGSKPCVEGGNILEDYDSKSFKNKRQPKFDIERKTSVLSDMLQGELRIPFADPAIDPVQDSIKDVYVKRDKRGKQLDWVQYYRYMSDVLCNFNRVCVEVDVERQNELKIGGTKEYVRNKIGSVLMRYGVRPASRAHLHEVVQELDPCCEMMVRFLKMTSPSCVNHIFSLEDEEIVVPKPIECDKPDPDYKQFIPPPLQMRKRPSRYTVESLKELKDEKVKKEKEWKEWREKKEREDREREEKKDESDYDSADEAMLKLTEELKERKEKERKELKEKKDKQRKERKEKKEKDGSDDEEEMLNARKH
ncbi:hypothetical protein GGI26_006487 [Coemansia sp. RSA 1358]|nr:hypothetical protein GGI26_006487 [Coemansia sp. RSA 1358]